MSAFNFKELYFTEHALKRAQERGLKPSDVWAVWHHPESSRSSSTRGSFIYWRQFGNQRVEVVAKKDEKGRWLVISVWVRDL